MALSKSVIKAQDIVSCNLCESETKLKWKCLDCDLLMCNKCCEKVHPKFKNAKDHTIVDIKQVGVSGTNRNPDFTNIKCKVHSAQSCCIFCSDCDNLACPSCITKGHTGHTFIEIKKAYDMKVELLKNRKRIFEMNEKSLDDGEKTLDQISVRENSNCQNTVQDIENQREALKREIDKYAIKLIDEVYQNMESVQNSIYIEKKKVLTGRQKEENKITTVEESLLTMDISFFFDSIGNLFDDDTLEGVKIIQKSVPKFTPGTISQSSFGSLYDDVSSSSTVIDMKVKKQFTTGLSYCQVISVCSDGSLWIGDTLSKHVQKAKPDGNILKTIISINTELRGIAVIYQNDLLITDATSKLKLINGKTGKVSDSKYNVDPLLIIGVHITSDHTVIVGAISPCIEIFPVTGRRVVIVMNEKGNHLTVYEQNKRKQNIFSYPLSITSISNGNVSVVDRIANDFSGRVVVLGKDDDILNEYTGCQDAKTNDQSFKPVIITTTPSDNLIVIDTYHHLHILDSSAKLMLCYNIKDIGIEFPYCLAFKSSTTFYIGSSPPERRTTIGKLSEIHYSGF